jgi:hypothetical protein
MLDDIGLFSIEVELFDISELLGDTSKRLCSIEAGAGLTWTDGTGHEARAPPRTFSEAEASASQGS